MKNLLRVANIYISQAEFINFFLPPVVIIAVISGLVAGKISDGTISAGFKHAFIMATVSLIAFWISGLYAPTFLTIPTTTP